jgi:hypothetical protein
LPARAVDDGNPSRVRHVDEDPPARGSELEGLPMGLERNIGDLDAGRRIDRRERPAPIADEHPVCRFRQFYASRRSIDEWNGGLILP